MYKLIFCVDIVERFSLTLMLWIVAFRNLVELSGSEFDFAGGFVLPKSFLLPKSFSWFRVNNVLWTISYVRNTFFCPKPFSDAYTYSL